MVVFYGPGIEVAHLNKLHDFLAARGWQLDEHTHRDEHGYPEDPEAVWRYAASLGGIAIHEIPDLTPAVLSCRFDFDDGLSILVIAAGNEKGCPAHNVAEHLIAVEGDELALDRLSALLDDLEPNARALDAR